MTDHLAPLRLMNNALQDKFEKFRKEKETFLSKGDHLSNKKIRERTAETSWSIIEIYDHLLTSESASFSYLSKKILAADKIPEKDFLSPLRAWAVVWLLDSPFKFKAPKGLKEPNNQKQLSDIKKDWTNLMENLGSFILVYPDNYLSKAIFKHPIAGRITLIQMLDFFRAHQRHHQRQIEGIIRSISSASK